MKWSLEYSPMFRETVYTAHNGDATYTVRRPDNNGTSLTSVVFADGKGRPVGLGAYKSAHEAMQACEMDQYRVAPPLNSVPLSPDEPIDDTAESALPACAAPEELRMRRITVVARGRIGDDLLTPALIAALVECHGTQHDADRVGSFRAGNGVTIEWIAE